MCSTHFLLPCLVAPSMKGWRSMDAQLQHLADEFNRLSERIYGIENRPDALSVRLQVMKDELRADLKITLDQIDGLRHLLELSRQEELEQRRADQQLLYALVTAHSRRLRAIERLERRRGAPQ